MGALRNVFNRSRIRMGSVDNSRIQTTPIRNAGFVSFMSQSGALQRRGGDYHDARLRRQRRVRALAALIITGACTWFVIESARAISTF